MSAGTDSPRSRTAASAPKAWLIFAMNTAVGVGSTLEQRLHHAPPLLLTQGCRQHDGVDARPPRAIDETVTAPRDRIQLGWPRQVPDPGMAELEEVSGDDPAGLRVSHVDVPPAAGVASIHEHGRHEPRREHVELPIAEPGALDQEPVDPSLFDEALVCFLRCRRSHRSPRRGRGRSRAPTRSKAPRTIGELTGLRSDGTRRPSVPVEASRRPRAIALAGSGAPWRPRVSALASRPIAASPRPLMTRDAVDTCTPAARATSSSRADRMWRAIGDAMIVRAASLS